MTTDGERGRWTRAGGLGVSLLAAALAAPGPGEAQDGVLRGTDPGWLPWVGCWEVVAEESGGDGDAAPSLVCVVPAAGGPHVELATVEGGRVVSRDLLRADGRARDSAVDGCEGWERGAFSEDGRRVYFRAEHVCPGGVEREASGMLAWVSPYEWMEVRTVEIRETPRTWVRRYRTASPEDLEAADGVAAIPESGMAGESARMAAAARVRVEDLVEASDHVHSDALRAWVAEQADPFDLDAEILLELAEAGVPDEVIDVVVAVSYPDRFAVDRGGAVEERAPVRDRRGDHFRGRRPVRGGWYPGWYGYGPYGAWYGSRYRPYGYRPGTVYVVPRSGSGGRAVPGRGYTRSSGSDGGTARPSRRPDRSSSGSSGPAPSTERSGGSGATVSPSGGYRSGGSSDSDGGGTARRRGGGPSGSDDGGTGSR